MKETLTCKTCGNRFEGKYCNVCGEKVYGNKDRSLLHLLEEGFHFVTHFEGTFFTTLKTVLGKPGQLSLDYCNGIRKKYFKPLSFFLMLVILYLLFPLFEGLNMDLAFHMQNDFYGQYAERKVNVLMASTGMDFKTLAMEFHHKGEKTSKFLLFMIIPSMALFTWLLGFKKKRFYFDHFIFSVEMMSLLILWGFLVLPHLLLLFRWALPAAWMQTELVPGIMLMSGFLIYACFAARRFFHFKVWYSIVFGLLYSVVLILFIQFVYKAILFYISINQLH